MKKLLICCIAALLLCGCSATTDADSKTGISEKDFILSVDGKELVLDAVFDPKTISRSYEVYENTSCGYDGSEFIYTYDDFELYTYPVGTQNHISMILVFDNLKTTKGISVGDSLQSVISAYGENYEERMGSYIYSLNKMELIFKTTGDIVVEIDYQFIAQ